MTTSYELYDGQVTLSFSPGIHSYEVSGPLICAPGDPPFKVPSVTGITGVIGKGGGLVQWAANQATYFLRDSLRSATGESVQELIASDSVWNDGRFAHRRKKEEAADIGSIAHAWVEQLLRGGVAASPIEPRAKSCCDAAVAWLSKYLPHGLAFERKIYSRRYGFAGTLDKIAVIDGQLCLIDWKTGNAVYPEHRLQTAAYAAAYTEETGQEIKKRWIVRLGKTDGKFEAHEITDGLRSDFATFLAAKEIWTWQQAQKSRNGK